MPRVCTICTHPEREAIDRALLSEEPFRSIADRFGPSKTALIRYKGEHLPQTLVKAKEEGEVRHAIDVVKQLRAISGATIAILQGARHMGNPVLALKAIDRVQKQIELQAKLLGELQGEEATVVNILVSAAWQQVRSTILHALGPYPEARLAVARALAEGNGRARN